MKIRVGFGFDVHQLVEGRELWLGGILSVSYTHLVHLDKNLTKADMEQIAAGIQLEDGEIHADAISYTDEHDKFSSSGISGVSAWKPEMCIRDRVKISKQAPF